MANGDKKLGRNSASVEVAGTGASLPVICGFKPDKVEIYNRTRNSMAVWTSQMPEASAQKMVDSGAGTTDISFVTVNGITPTFNGFNLGTDTDLNQAADVIYCVAFKH